MTGETLPAADSPEVFLDVASTEEHRTTWHHNSAEWQGPLAFEGYLRREEHLLSQDLVKNGGLTPWILVHQPQGGPRKILCACETINKRAVVAVDGKIEEGICHGVASVFCPAEHRGKGYAGKMISELAKRIEKWQQVDKRVLFSILFSDIGKKFYAGHGWQAFKSTHVSLPPASSELRPGVSYLTTEDIPALCGEDETAIVQQVKTSSTQGTTVTVIPDARTIRWHQARADYFAQELLGKHIPNKGALVKLPDGRRAWCYWQHNWSKVEASKDNKLYILRIASTDGTDAERQADLVEPLLAAAQAEAAAWGLSSVEMWSPTPGQKLAAQRLDPQAHEVERESSSIVSLLWFGEGDWRKLQWLCKERFAWC